MRSSISSSDSAGKWVLTLLSAAILALIVITSVELLWRASGHHPSVTDDKDLWAVERHRIGNGTNNMVLLGASRMQIDISIPVLKRHLPNFTISQLAIDGLHPIAALQDLAENSDFKGVVLCSIIAPGFERRNWDQQRPYVVYHNDVSTLNLRLNRRIASFFQERMTVLHPWIKLKKTLVRYLKTKRWPRPYYILTHADRGRDADYTKVDIDAHKRDRLKRLHAFYVDRNPPLPVEQWRKEAEMVDHWAAMIQKRGGRVVFIRLPTSGEHWQMDEQYYPRRLYWDVFAKATVATSLHFADVAALSGYVLPDTSHIDAKDKERFTEAVFQRLKTLGVFNS